MKQKTNQNKPSLISGISLSVMTILSMIVFGSLKADLFHTLGVFITIILDVVIAWGLYEFFKQTDKTLSLITAGLRTIYAVIFFYALTQITNLDTFNHIWDKGLALFGLHLLVLGILTIKAKYVPNFWGYLLVFTSIGYIIDGIGKFVGYSSSLTMLTFWGEVLFGVWLVVKGRKIPKKSGSVVQ